MSYCANARRRAALSLGIGLILGTSAPASAAGTTVEEQVARRLIVRYHDDATPGPRALQVKQTVAAAMARAGVAASSFSPPTVGASASGPLARRLGTGAELVQLPQTLEAAQIQRLVNEVAADPAVRYAVPDSLQQPLQAPPAYRPNDPLFASHQWHFDDPVGGVNAPVAWARSRGAGVVVAVLDTGILPDHPDFKGSRVLPGYDFISHPSMSRRTQAGRAPGGIDRGDWAPAGLCAAGSKAASSGWHGTHVAGTVAQSMDNRSGGTGLAPAATLLPVRVLGTCGGAVSDIVDAITWASGGTVPGVPNNPDPAQVINLSLGGEGPCQRPYQEAIDAAVRRGTVVVVAAGNSAGDARHFNPSSCLNVITVGSTGASGSKVGHSNFGPAVDLSAPGGDYNGEIRGYVWQTGHTGKTDIASGVYSMKPMAGTSMATPHVAATAALVQSARVAAGRLPLAPSRMKALLRQTVRAFPVVPPAATPIGRGILDSGAAVNLAVAAHCDIARTDCLPQALQAQVPADGQAADSIGTRFTFTAAAGRPLRVMTYGGQGGATLYVQRGAPPQSDRLDARSARPGTHQAVLVPKPAADVYHVLLVGAPAFEGVTVVVRQ